MAFVNFFSCYLPPEPGFRRLSLTRGKKDPRPSPDEGRVVQSLSGEAMKNIPDGQSQAI